jgi:hypothetical protein
MLVGVLDERETPGQHDIRLLPILPEAVIMGDGVLDRIDPLEIGLVHHVLAAGAAMRFLPQLRFQRGGHLIEHRHGGRPRWRQCSSSRLRVSGLTRV